MKTISKHVLAAAALAVLITGCSTQNKAEKEADKITKAVIANNMAPVMGDFDSQMRVKVTPIVVAQLSTELNGEGKYQSIKEVTPPNSAPGEHDFDAQFEKHMYSEVMVLDDSGAVRSWHIKMKTAAAPASP